MARINASRRPLFGVFLVVAAVFLASACTTSDTRAEPEAMAAPPAAPAPASRPIVLTQIKTEQGSCTPKFANNNCGAIGNPGDICISGGSDANPTRASLIFVVAGPGAESAKIEKMTISLAANGSCPGDVQNDFPQFNSSCEFAPTSPGNSMQVMDDNEIARIWNYSITLIPRAGCESVTIHPVIDNGGGNTATDEPPP